MAAPPNRRPHLLGPRRARHPRASCSSRPPLRPGLAGPGRCDREPRLPQPGGGRRRGDRLGGTVGRRARFAIVIRSRGAEHGWGKDIGRRLDRRDQAREAIPGVRAIVVYSRCPHSPFAGGRPGQAGTDGCRLWWAPLSGGCPTGSRRLHPTRPSGRRATGRGGLRGAAQHRPRTAGRPARALDAHRSRQRDPPSPQRPGRRSPTWRRRGPGRSRSSSSRTPPNRARQPPRCGWRARAQRRRCSRSRSPTRCRSTDSARFFDGLALTSTDAYAFLYANRGVFPPGGLGSSSRYLSPPGARPRPRPGSRPGRSARSGSRTPPSTRARTSSCWACSPNSSTSPARRRAAPGTGAAPAPARSSRAGPSAFLPSGRARPVSRA